MADKLIISFEEYLKTVAMVKLVLIDRNSKVIKIKKYLKSNFFQN